MKYYINKKCTEIVICMKNYDEIDELENNIPNYKVNEQAANSDRPTSKGWLLYGHNAVGITYEIGDKTPIENINLFGKESAKQMMSILLNK